MRNGFSVVFVSLLLLAFSGQNARGQNSQAQPPSQPSGTSQPALQPNSQQRSPGGDVGSGAGDVGKGAAKGTGAAAKGVGKGAGDLVTLHPLDAAGNVGKGAAVAGKDVGTGAVKGTGKIAKGTGRGVGKIFHHGDKPQSSPAPAQPQN